MSILNCVTKETQWGHDFVDNLPERAQACRCSDAGYQQNDIPKTGKITAAFQHRFALYRGKKLSFLFLSQLYNVFLILFNEFKLFFYT